jgi:hypothetical protein
VPQVVPVQVDVSEPLLALSREVFVAALAPARVHAVRLQNGHHPRLLECLQLLSNLVTEHRDIVVLAFAGTVEAEIASAPSPVRIPAAALPRFAAVARDSLRIPDPIRAA